MAFDFRKEYKAFYLPKDKPEIVTVPPANYIAVRGTGDPNEEGGAYQKAISVLYAVAYTLKMSYKTDYRIEGFFEYVVPPLEGFWESDTEGSFDYADKSQLRWMMIWRIIILILPEQKATGPAWGIWYILAPSSTNLIRFLNYITLIFKYAIKYNPNEILEALCPIQLIMRQKQKARLMHL